MLGTRFPTLCDSCHGGYSAKAFPRRRESFQQNTALYVGVLSAGLGSPHCAQHKPKDEDCLTCHGDAHANVRMWAAKSCQPLRRCQETEAFHSRLDKLAAWIATRTLKAFRTKRRPKRSLCAECHASAKNAYAHSTHAKAVSAGKAAADCQDCHGDAHKSWLAVILIRPSITRNIPATCGRCHGQKFLMESNGSKRSAFCLVPGQRSRTRR